MSPLDFRRFLTSFCSTVQAVQAVQAHDPDNLNRHSRASKIEIPVETNLCQQTNKPLSVHTQKYAIEQNLGHPSVKTEKSLIYLIGRGT